MNARGEVLWRTQNAGMEKSWPKAMPHFAICILKFYRCNEER